MVFPNMIEAVGQVALEAFLAKFALLSILSSDLDQQGFVLEFNAGPLRKIGERGFGNSLLVGLSHDQSYCDEVAFDLDEGEIRLGLLLDQIDGFRGEAFLGLVFKFLPHLIDTFLQLTCEYPIGQGNDFGGIR